MTPTNQTMGILYVRIILPPKVRADVYIYKGNIAEYSGEKGLLFCFVLFFKLSNSAFCTFR